VDIVWDGITRAETLAPEGVRLRNALADAAKSYKWTQVLDLLSKYGELVNTTRPGGSSLYTPLHQAAHGGAPVEVVQRLIGMFAFRTLRNARGERPFDVTERRGHRHLLGALAPEYKHHVPARVLLKLQSHFHAVIRGRIDQPIPDHGLRLPELEVLLELERPHMWFPVPGMAGGFSYWLEPTGDDARLMSESRSRMVGGSGQRHEITSAGSRLVDEGFV